MTPSPSRTASPQPGHEGRGDRDDKDDKGGKDGKGDKDDKGEKNVQDGQGGHSPLPTATQGKASSRPGLVSGPNPAKDKLSVRVKLGRPCRARLVLRSLAGGAFGGQKLGDLPEGEWQGEISCRDWPDGIYWMDLMSEEGGTEKFEARFKVAVLHR